MVMEAAARPGRPLEETVVQRANKPGRPLAETVVDGYEVARLRRQLVRRTVAIELSLDRRLRQIIGEDGRTYSAAVEDAVRRYVEGAAS